MDENQKQQWLDDLFPVNGEERWIKVRCHNQEKAVKLLWMPMDDERAKPFVEANGFQVTALSFREEYTPQVSALYDLKADIIDALSGRVPEDVVEGINGLIRNKIEEVKRHVIKTETPQF